jgi:hypothetical protein
MGRATVRRSEGLARDEEVPLAKARKGEHRSVADRLWSENVKRLLTFGGRGPKKPAQAAAPAAVLRPPVATRHQIGRVREHRWSHTESG